MLAIEMLNCVSGLSRGHSPLHSSHSLFHFVHSLLHSSSHKYFFRENIFPKTCLDSEVVGTILWYQLNERVIEGNVVYEAFKISLVYLYSGKVK